MKVHATPTHFVRYYRIPPKIDGTGGRLYMQQGNPRVCEDCEATANWYVGFQAGYCDQHRTSDARPIEVIVSAPAAPDWKEVQ